MASTRKVEAFSFLRPNVEEERIVRGYKEICEAILAVSDRLIRQAEADEADFFGERLKALKGKLESEHFHIVVMGQFKRGKTTFINSLLGVELLPSSVVPLTSINTILRYGGELKADVHYLDGKSEEIDIADLPRFVTERQNPENQLGVKRVEVFYPSPYLKDGVCLVDTPGTGSTYLHNDETAYSFIEHADAVIFMISSDPPVSRSELEFLHRIRGDVRKVFFVQNKVDYLEPGEREESLAFNRQAISGALDIDAVIIHPLSAKMALAATINGDASLMERSGLPGFVSGLEDFLMREKGGVLLETSIKNLRKAIDDEFAALELQMTLLAHPLEDLQEKVDAFQDQMGLIRREREEVRFLIEGDHKRLVRDILDEDVQQFKARETEPLLRRYDAFFNENASLPGSSLADALGKFIQDEIRETFSGWRHEEEERLSREFQMMAARHMDRANSIANRILEIAGDLFGISLPRLEAELDLSEEGEFWFRMGDPPTDLEVFFGAIARALPRKLSNRLLKRSKRDELLELFDRHCGRVRYDFYLRLQKSVGALSYSVDDVIRETLEAVETGIDKAMRQLRGGKEELHVVLGRLRERQSRLEEAGRELAALMDEVLEVRHAP
jgi:GTP-binding protein EngB required for normal cell division/chaperonin cofactor prefoldin